MNKRKIMKWTNSLLSGILFVLLISVAATVGIAKASGGEPQVFGYQLKTVLSGSMEPGIQTGSIIAVKPTDNKKNFKKGDIITFQNEEGILITHRITEVNKQGDNVTYYTKGDNNNAEDTNPVLSDNVVAEYTDFTVPYVGYFINFSQSKNGAFLLLIPGFILLFYSVLTIWKALKELELSKNNQTDTLKNTSGNNPS